MSDQSRIEAVSQAIQRAASENLTYEQIAQAAIEANDAWFQTHGWKAVPREHPRGEDRLDLAQAIMADQEMRTWQRLYDLAPSPEEVDR